MNVKNLPFYNSMKGLSFITHIKLQKFNFINSGHVGIIRTVYYVMNDGPYTLL